MNPRTDWFRDARFGLFIHWGLYAVLGRGEWVMSREAIPTDQYQRLAEDFRAESYDPISWAAMARDAGMRYAVLTAKHHEGFCLWGSRTCAFNATRTAAGRDLFGDYVEAFRNAGLRVGVYYSLGDWYHPDWRLGFQGDDEAVVRFMAYTHDLVRELVTDYGKLDLLFYDLPQNYSSDQWRMVDLNAMVRSHQPGILINNRGMTTEDYATPEQHAVASAPGRLWETCMTINRNWGYSPYDSWSKSSREITSTLIQIASEAGNLLLNVGPDPSGMIPEPSQRVLGEIGRWLDVHGEAIYGSQRHNMSWNLFGSCTARDNHLYLHLENYFGEQLTLAALCNKVKSARLLTTGQALKVEQHGTRLELFGLPANQPDPTEVGIPVIDLELDGPARQDYTDALGIADIFPVFPA